MLQGISRLISPDLIKILMEMGHGDEIVFADANFPSSSHARRLVRADGLLIGPLLEAVLPWFPVDGYVKQPIVLMQTEPQDAGTPPIWAAYQTILAAYKIEASKIAYVERQSFYDRSRNAFAIVATGESALYGNILLTKGVVINDV